MNQKEISKIAEIIKSKLDDTQEEYQDKIIMLHQIAKEIADCLCLKCRDRFQFLKTAGVKE